MSRVDARRGRARRLAAVLAGLALAVPVRAAGSGAAPVTPGDLTVLVEGLRSAKGMIRACLTRDPRLYLHCDRDPAALKESVSAGKDARLDFPDVPPGDYVLSVLHDENDNNKVDTFLGIPREGVGFSRNPAMHFGPPKWAAAVIHVPGGPSETEVRIKYFL